MDYQYRVTYRTQKVQVNDPLYGLLLDKQVRFPTFTTAVNFARDLKTNNDERLVGKPMVEEA